MVLATFTILLSATHFRHTDVGDAQVYQVIARNMVEDGQWLSLRYLPVVHPHFHEHLPFGIWLLAAPMGLLGEWSLRPLFALMSVGVVLLAGRVATRLGGGWAGLMAMLVLATTDKFFFQAGYPLLDPPLLLFATGAAAACLTGELGWKRWLVAGVLAAGAAAVKGPFGLLPLAAAVVARGAIDRRWQTLAKGSAALLAAAAPVALFLLFRSDWWEGYVLRQLLDSLTGARSDGSLDRWFAVKVIAGRFWPWLPLLAPAAVLAVGRPLGVARWLTGTREVKSAVRLLLLACAVVVFGLSLPARKIWHHTLIVYPLLAILCGLALGPRIEQWLGTPARTRRAVLGLAALTLASALAVCLGLERLLMAPPCAMETEFAQVLGTVPPRTKVLVVSERDEWDVLSDLAWDRGLTPWPVRSLDPGTNEGPAGLAPLALVAEQLWDSPRSWRELARGRSWVLATRAGEAPPTP